MHKLPERFQDKVNEMPEYSYGMNRVIVTLDDGTKISDVYIAWGEEIVKVGQSKEVKFDATRIVDVEKQ